MYNANKCQMYKQMSYTYAIYLTFKTLKIRIINFKHLNILQTAVLNLTIKIKQKSCFQKFKHFIKYLNCFINLNIITKNANNFS